MPTTNMMRRLTASLYGLGLLDEARGSIWAGVPLESGACKLGLIPIIDPKGKLVA